ncbi:MAG: hypothetical protein QG622_492 [Actinomycetota bacterium]|nr:hypothetical protein [Actinomycetota bacterium]
MARASADKTTTSKASKKTSKAPKKQGRIAQLRAVFTMTRQADPAVVWWMLLGFFVTLGVFFGVGVLVGHPIYVSVLGSTVAFMVALVIMARRAERAAYARFAGQPGASAMGLQNLRRGWSVEQEPVAVDPRTQDVVFRAVGRPGVVLVAEGAPGRANRLADNERKRIARVLGANVPVTILLCGEGEDQIPLRKLSGKIMRLKPTLTKTEVGEVAKRLRALGGVRPPIPKGVDPTRVRPDRRATKGR